jgi:hypothetical protein
MGAMGLPFRDYIIREEKDSIIIIEKENPISIAPEEIGGNEMEDFSCLLL